MIYLPLFRRKPPQPQLPIEDFTVFSIGYKDLVGIEGYRSMTRVEEQIGEYNLYAVLEVCAKVSLTLLRRGISSPLGQAELLAGLIPDKNLRTRYFDKARARAAGSQWTIFNQQSVQTLVKLALSKCDPMTGKSVQGDDLTQLAYWLMIINDERYASESGERITLPSREHERERLRDALSRYQFFMSSERVAYKIGRYRWIIDYFRKNKPHGVDIEKLFAEATGGVSLYDYMYVCSSLLVRWVNLSTKKKFDINVDWVTCPDIYFKKTKLNKSSIQQVLGLISMLPQEFEEISREATQTVLGGKDQFHYNFLALVWKPFVWYQDKKCFICPSPEYLFDKVTEGVYRTIETFLRQSGRTKERDTFATAWGDVFEKYINSCLSSAFSKDFQENVIDKVSKEQMLDGLVNSPNFIFLVETKNIHWSYKSIVSGNLTSSESAIKQLFTEKGIQQIYRFISKSKSGEWTLPIDTNGKEFIPVLVVPETIPVDAYNRRLFDNLAKKSGQVKEYPDVLPYIILTAEEVEILEAIAVSRGSREAVEILAEYSHNFKVKNEIGLSPQALSFKNFLYSRGYEKLDKSTNNKRILTHFDDVMDEVCKVAFGVPLRKRVSKRATLRK